MPAGASALSRAHARLELAVPIGKSKVTQALREQVQQAASSTSPVLLLGELGSGREAYARYLHSLSARAPPSRSSWWSAASLGPDPAAALFGSERDGKVEPGALDQAAGGSLYLNGLEDLTSEAQRALVGAIEQNGYTRVGGRAAAAAQRALDQFGAGRLRVARRRRSRFAAI